MNPQHQQSSEQLCTLRLFEATVCLFTRFKLAQLVRSGGTMGNRAYHVHHRENWLSSNPDVPMRQSSVHTLICVRLWGKEGGVCKNRTEEPKETDDAWGKAQSPVTGSCGREETASPQQQMSLVLFFFAHLTRYSINVRQRMRRSKHVIMKKEGRHLVHVRCLDCKMLQCPGDLGEACAGTILAIYIGISDSLVGTRECIYVDCKQTYFEYVRSFPTPGSWLRSLGQTCGKPTDRHVEGIFCCRRVLWAQQFLTKEAFLQMAACLELGGMLFGP